jgi:hypothetical protein
MQQTPFVPSAVVKCRSDMRPQQQQQQQTGALDPQLNCCGW